MPINDKPCDQCAFFDPVMRGQTAKGGLKETNWGWCAKKSKYPAKEGPGQKFPADVQRVGEGELAQPLIVRRGEVQGNCTEFTPRGTRPSKSDLLKQLADQVGGGRIIGH